MLAFSIPEAEAHLADLVEHVKTSAEPVFLLRFGQVVARITPVEPPVRDVSPDPILGKVEIKGDLFADHSSDWECA